MYCVQICRMDHGQCNILSGVQQQQLNTNWWWLDQWMRWGSIITKECLNLQPRWMARDGLLIVFARHDLWLFIFNGVGRPTQKRWGLLLLVVWMGSVGICLLKLLR